MKHRKKKIKLCKVLHYEIKVRLSFCPIYQIISAKQTFFKNIFQKSALIQKISLIGQTDGQT